jgi:hypothetical protein
MVLVSLSRPYNCLLFSQGWFIVARTFDLHMFLNQETQQKEVSFNNKEQTNDDLF